MTRFLSVLALALACAAPVRAADAPKPPGKTAQGERMKGCSADAKAKGLKGDERKAFMSDCLKKKA